MDRIGHCNRGYIFTVPVEDQNLLFPPSGRKKRSAATSSSHFFESWLDRKRPSRPAPITFTSDRKPVTLPLEEILYVESNDDIATVIATSGRRFRNKTPISRKYKDAVTLNKVGSGA